MTVQAIPSARPSPSQAGAQSWSDTLVLGSMALAAAAIGVASCRQLGAGIELGTAIALAAFSLLSSAHVLRASSSPRSQPRDRRRFGPVLPGREHALAHTHASDPTPKSAMPRTAPNLPVGLQSHAPQAEPRAERSGRDEPQLPNIVPAAIPDASELSTADPMTAIASATSPGVVPTPRDASLRRPPDAAERQPIDELLRRLANQIEAGQHPGTATVTAGTGEASPLQAVGGEGDIAAAINQLRQAGTSGGASPEAAAPRPDDAEVPLRARLGEIAHAIQSEQLQVLVEPILGLADHRPQHFEVSIRLLARDGQAFEGGDLVPTARGTGLLPLLDALRVKHSGRIAKRLELRSRDGAVFSQVSGESLGNEGFLITVAERQGEGDVNAERLVLAFSQADVRAFSPAQWKALGGLQAQGFRFALEDVTDLDMDFEAVSSAGFWFVKLDATVFLGGLALANATVPASDLCRYFAGMGLKIIVGHIDDERVHARVLGFGVLFGQGAMFGGPRPLEIQAPAA